MWVNDFEFDVIWKQDFNCFWSYILTFQYYGLFVGFRDFKVFVFEYRAQNENPEITANPYFWVHKVEMNVDLFFEHYFKFFRTKTEPPPPKKNKQNRLKLTNLKRLESLERQKCGT